MTGSSGFITRCGVVRKAVADSARVMLPVLVVLAGVSGFRGAAFSLEHVVREAPPVLITVVTGWLSGVVLGPWLLPWLPGERFSFKGAMAGGLGLLAWPAACGWLHLRPVDVGMALILVPVLASFWLMQEAAIFGAGYAQVGRREWRMALVIQGFLTVAAFVPWVILRFL